MKLRNLAYFFMIVVAFIGCKGDPKPDSTPIVPATKATVPAFNADSAYAYIVAQLDFGYRVPGTQAHEECRDWIVEKLSAFGYKPEVQEFKERIHTGVTMPGYNIIAQHNPELNKRVVLAAHWDTRYAADKDSDPENHNKPILGADDGASGVAGLLEIARLIKENNINLGVDFIFFDIEDQGAMGENQTHTWALGSQYWSRNKVPKNYQADFGILLDMIAAKGARFGREGYSTRYAGVYQNKIWKLAQNMGYSDLFQDFNAGGIADDHLYMNQAGIPTVNIISTPNPSNAESSFGHYHHTIADDLDIIDKRNLKVVGQVVTAVIYRYSDGSF